MPPPRADAPRALPIRRADETEVKSVLKGLAHRQQTTVADVARKLESGLLSREHCLGALRLQWTFEKMCDEDRFAEPIVREAPTARDDDAGDRDDPRAA